MAIVLPWGVAPTKKMRHSIGVEWARVYSRALGPAGHRFDQ